MKRSYFIISGLIVILVIGGLLWSYWSHKSGSSSGSNLSDTVSSPDVAEDIAALAPPNSTNLYINAKYDFSFEKPTGYTVGALHDGIGETLVVQNAQKDGGFQVYITPLDESTELTPARIQSDIPGTSVVNPLKIKLDNKADGMMFESNNSAFGNKSYEIWFTYKDYLYQVSSYKDFAEELKKIIGTWKFQ